MAGVTLFWGVYSWTSWSTSLENQSVLSEKTPAYLQQFCCHYFKNSPLEIFPIRNNWNNIGTPPSKKKSLDKITGVWYTNRQIYFFFGSLISRSEMHIFPHGTAVIVQGDNFLASRHLGLEVLVFGLLSAPPSVVYSLATTSSKSQGSVILMQISYKHIQLNSFGALCLHHG